MHVYEALGNRLFGRKRSQQRDCKYGPMSVHAVFARRLRCEALEDRRMLSIGGYPDLPGMVLVDPVENQFEGQVVYLDFDGAENVTYNGPVVVEGIDIPAFDVPDTTDTEEEVVIDTFVAALEDVFTETGIIFTTEQPARSGYSTVFIGGDGSAFEEYGDYLGLAEQVDVGNSSPGDSALVFSERILAGGSSDSLIGVTVHEIGHLLGYVHGHENTATVSSRLGSVAYETGVHEYIAEEASDIYRALFGISGITLEHQVYLSLSTTSSWDTGNSITEGVVDEDATPIMLRFMDHFSAGGDGSELTDGLFLYGSAYTKAANSTFPEAKSSFNSGVKTDAYYWLGRTMHLLQDSTVPAHVHNDPHSGSFFDGDDKYEENVGSYTSSFDFDIAQNGWSWDFQDWNGDWSNPQSLWDRSDDYGSLEALFRETTDYTDDYDSDDYPGDWHNSTFGDHVSIARLSQLDRSHHDDWANNNVNGDGSELNSTEVGYLARDLGTWSVEQSAMLMRYFYADLGEVVSNPAGMHIDGTSASSIQLGWSGVSGADGYTVYRSTSPGSGFSRVASISGSSYDDTGLDADTTYYYRVYAYNDVAGLGSAYSSVSATTPWPPTADAGGPYSVNEGSVVTLSASGSHDPDGYIASYLWDLDNDGQYDDDSGVTVDYNANAYGVFTVSVEVTDDDGAWDTSSATVTVLAANPLPGDANRDGTVDQADSVIVSANWQMQIGAGWSDGDFNDDHRVDDRDATIMAANWGRTLPPATSYSAATEPDVETLAAAPEVSYDLDNDGRIGLGDLAFFASVYREKPGITTESPYAYAADFDLSGTIDLGDLALFAANYRLGRPNDSLAYPVEVSQSISAAPKTALTVAAAPTILPGDANRDGAVDDDDAIVLTRNWQKQTSATWADGDFNADGLVGDFDATILAQHWMMSFEDMDDDDDARDKVFAAVGATDDAIGLFDE